MALIFGDFWTFSCLIRFFLAFIRAHFKNSWESQRIRSHLGLTITEEASICFTDVTFVRLWTAEWKILAVLWEKTQKLETLVLILFEDRANILFTMRQKLIKNADQKSNLVLNHRKHVNKASKLSGIFSKNFRHLESTWWISRASRLLHNNKDEMEIDMFSMQMWGWQFSRKKRNFENLRIRHRFYEGIAAKLSTSNWFGANFTWEKNGRKQLKTHRTSSMKIQPRPLLPRPDRSIWLSLKFSFDFHGRWSSEFFISISFYLFLTVMEFPESSLISDAV